MENPQQEMRRRLPVEQIAAVTNWIRDSECAELDPVSGQFDSFTRGRARSWLHRVRIKYWEIRKGNFVFFGIDYEFLFKFFDI